VQRRFFAIITLVFVLGMLLTACGSTTTSAQTPCPTMKAVDAYWKPITFSCTAPKKIITLIPSESEIVAALGLDSKVCPVPGRRQSRFRRG